MAITVDTTSLDLHKPELWSRLIVRETERNLVFASRFDRRYEKEAKGRAYDQINVGTISNFAVGDTLGVAGTLTAGTPVNDPELDFNIAINTHAYKHFDMETEAIIMTEGDLLEEYAKKAAYSVVWKIDTDCAAFVDDFDLTVGTLAVELTDDLVIDANRQMDDANCPPNDRYFCMSSRQAAAFRNVDKYINQLYKQGVGGVDTSKGAGVFANIYGLEWCMSTNVEGSNAAGHDNAIFQREAVALCIIDNMRTKRFYEIDTDSEKLAVHAIYGALEVRGGAFTGTAGQMGGWGVWAKGY